MSGHDYRPYDENNVFDAVSEFSKLNRLNISVDKYDWWVWK